MPSFIKIIENNTIPRSKAEDPRMSKMFTAWKFLDLFGWAFEHCSNNGELTANKRLLTVA